MKQGQNPRYNRRNSAVKIRDADLEELRFKKQKRGRGWVKPSRQIGDLRPMFGEEYIAFKGGEGGRGWSISGTTFS